MQRLAQLVRRWRESALGHDLTKALLLFLLWRGVLFAFAFVAGSLTTDRFPHGLNHDWNGGWFWNGWARWDAGWYRDVVRKGYYVVPGYGESTVAFFPLYAYATKVLFFLTRNLLAAGLIVSNLSLVFSLFFVMRIGRRTFDEETVQRALVYLLVFPTSFFFSAFYSEGLFLLTTTAAFYYFLDERYFWCGIWGMLACLTRSSGVALFLAMAAGTLWNRRARLKPIRPGALWLLLIPCGLLIFMLILKVTVGDPLAFSKVQASWGRHFRFPLVTLWDEARRLDFSIPRNAKNIEILEGQLVSVLFLILPLFLIGNVDVSLVFYSVLLVLIPLSTGRVLSIPRFAAPIFPAFFAFAHLVRSRRSEQLFITTSALLLGFYTMQYFNQYWAN